MNDTEMRLPIKKKTAEIITILVLIAGAIGILSAFLHIRLIDFSNYLTATEHLLLGKNPYAVVEFFAPPWIAVFLAPLTFLPMEVASAIWLVVAILSQIGIGALVLLWERGSHSRTMRLSVPFFPALIPAALFSYITGQLSPLVTLSALLAIWIFLRTEIHPVTLGLLISISALKPHIVVIPLALCILELIRQRKLIALTWITLVLSFFVLISFLILPDWIPSLIGAWREGAYLGGPGLVAPGYRGIREFGVPLWVFVPLAVYLVRLWLKERLSPKVISLAFTTSLLLIPYARSYDQVVLAVPFSFIMLERVKKRIPTILVLLAVFVLPFTILWPLSPVVAAVALLMV